jgi:3-hydroxymyristoyl/3-hydroxydecanoyl-(acyl carrier protein) dehydratase
VTRSCTLSFAPDHPTAAGHFPGNPILPGALLLDEVVLAIAAGESRKAGAPMVRSA